MFSFLFNVIILATKIINSGFTNSTGWKFGRKNKLSHLFDPLTSTPNTGINQVRIAYVLNKDSLRRAINCLKEALSVYPGRKL